MASGSKAGSRQKSMAEINKGLDKIRKERLQRQSDLMSIVWE